MLGSFWSEIFGSFGNLLFTFLRVDCADPGSFPPPLSTDEEYELFRKMHAGDAGAREKLICHNLRLVAHIVKKYYGNAPSQEDLISIGTIGLIKAIDTFRYENGARFATYAGKCLQNEILMHFRAGKKRACEVSVNEAIDTDKDGNALTYLDIIPCDDDVTETINRSLLSDMAKEGIRLLLDERERQVITLRYGLYSESPLTQRETAQKLGISRSYVSRIEKGALEKLRAALERENG